MADRCSGPYPAEKLLDMKREPLLEDRGQRSDVLQEGRQHRLWCCEALFKLRRRQELEGLKGFGGQLAGTPDESLPKVCIYPDLLPHQAEENFADNETFEARAEIERLQDSAHEGCRERVHLHKLLDGHSEGLKLEHIWAPEALVHSGDDILQLDLVLLGADAVQCNKHLRGRDLLVVAQESRDDVLEVIWGEIDDLWQHRQNEILWK